MAGYVTECGVFVEVGAARLPLPARAERLTTWAAQLLPDLCEQCGEPVCECIPPDAMAALLARIDADPHGELDRSMEIPY